MSLIFSGASSFAISGNIKWIPSTWDLDQLIIPYRGKVTDLDAFLIAHPIGEASSIDGNMFLIQAPSDDHKQFPTVNLIYQGKRNGVLPPQQHETDDDVMSASSKRSSTNIILTQPMVVEYYGPTSILSYYSFGGPGVIDAPDPTPDPRPIDITFFDTTYDISTSAQNAINVFFSIQVISTLKSVEVVPGKYWKNTAKKSKVYSPFIFSGIASGPWITLGSPGVNYRVGDILTISSGGQSATIHVTQVLSIWGNQENAGIFAFTVSGATFSTAHQLLPGYGGYGSGALFNVAIIP